MLKNIAQKVIRIFLPPRRRRGFSRVDLIVFLILAVLAIVGVLAPSHISTPGAAAQPQLQNSHTRRSYTWLAIPVAGPPQPNPQPGPPPTHPAPNPNPHPQPNPQPNPPPTPPKSGTGTSQQSTCARNTALVNSPFQDNTPQPNAQNNIKTPGVANNFMFIFTDPCLTVGQSTGAVPIIWRWSLYVVDAFIVLTLVLQGIKIMLSGTIFRYASFVESLPGAICAIIAANASLVFITIILILNNALAVSLYDMANSQIQVTQSTVTRTECNEWFTAGGTIFGGIAGGIGGFVAGGPVGAAGGAAAGGGLVGWIGDMLGCHVFANHPNVNQGVQGSLQPGVPQIGGLSAIFQTFTNLEGFLTGLLILVIIGQMILRIFFIDLYAILAPIAIGCWALPGRVGQPVTQMWFKGFIATVMAQFAQVAGLIISQILTGAIINYMSTIPGLNQSLTQDLTLQFVIVMAQLWFIIRIPALFETAPTRAMVDVGSTMVQTVGTAIATKVMDMQFIASSIMTVAGLGIGAAALM